ncbi:MAG: response regulator [Deltaproteobacteria bacterium]|nr:response regulator [Deltaproteobacteria bacterium]
MAHTLLLVDDEENILKALTRLFRRQGYEILTALGGSPALELLATRPVSLILSDQRMPAMSGAEFLTAARKIQPDAVRMMLTGYSDIRTAIEAINEGHVTRFLVKPWQDDTLLETVAQALADLDLRRDHVVLQEKVRRHNDELVALNESLEKKVLERTAEVRDALKREEEVNETLRQQNGSIVKAFAGLLDLRSPAIGAHCRRVAGLVIPLSARLGIRDRRAVQDVVIAGLLHDIGKIAFPDAMIIKDPSHLGHQERGELRKHPVLGQSQLQVIDSLGEVGRMIRHHHENWDGSGYPDGLSSSDIPLGARILRVLDAYDHVSKGRPTRGGEDSLLLATLDGQVSHNFDGTVFSALLGILEARGDAYNPAREMKVPLDRLEVGMVLARDLRTESGVLLVGKDETLKPAYIDKIRNLKEIYTLEPHAYVCRV